MYALTRQLRRALALAHLRLSPNSLCTQGAPPPAARRRRRRARAWSAQEDHRLLHAFATYKQNWQQVAAHVRTRSASACRQRYQLSLSPSINRQPFTARELRQLRQLHKQLGKQWTLIAQRFGKRRTPAQLYELLNNRLNVAYRARKWTPHEHHLLVRAVRTYGEGKWSAVSRLVATRSDAQCYERWATTLKPSRRGAWTPDEDRLLLQAVHALRAQPNFNFGLVASQLAFTRSRKSCYARYKRLQRPQISRERGQQ